MKGRNPDEKDLVPQRRALATFDDLPMFAPPPPSPNEIAEGTRRKLAALDAIGEKHRALLDALQRELRLLCQQRAWSPLGDDGVTADDAFDILQRLDPQESVPRRVLSAAFRARGWEWTGRIVKSKRASNHASDLRVWRWQGQHGDA